MNHDLQTFLYFLSHWWPPPPISFDTNLLTDHFLLCYGKEELQLDRVQLRRGGSPLAVTDFRKIRDCRFCLMSGSWNKCKSKSGVSLNHSICNNGNKMSIPLTPSLPSDWGDYSGLFRCLVPKFGSRQEVPDPKKATRRRDGRDKREGDRRCRLSVYTVTDLFQSFVTRPVSEVPESRHSRKERSRIIPRLSRRRGRPETVNRAPDRGG